MTYAVKLSRDKGNFLVSFPDFSNVHTFGASEREALSNAVEALETMFMGMIEDREEVPAPRRLRKGERGITLPALTCAKIELYATMRSKKVGKAELARRLKCHAPQVDRLLDLNHASRLDQLEAAFRALGKELKVEIADAA
jgi:antitoxin HicB